MCRPLALGLVGCLLALALGCAPKPLVKPSPPAPPPRVIEQPAPPPAAATAPVEDLGPVWFRIGNRVVHETELDTWIRDDLFRRELSDANGTEQWSYRAEAAERMIDQMILEDEARRRGTKPGAVLQSEIYRLGPVTATELLRFFEDNRERWPAGMSFEDAAPDVRAYLEGQRPRKARESMRRRARVRFLAKPPKRSGAPASALTEPHQARGTQPTGP